MQGKIKHDSQLNMFKVQLTDIISVKNPLYILTKKINWQQVEQDFEPYYSKEGRPSVPTRTMVGLLLLKSMFNESDENVVPKWVENPYWQYFCGEQYFRHDPPCDPSELVHFRKRIQQSGHEYILKLTAELHGKEILESRIVIDTTVQEKNITYPTDAKLAVAILNECWRLADQQDIKLHQSYTRKTKSAKLQLRFGTHPTKKKQAKQAVKDLRKYARKVIQQLERMLSSEMKIAKQGRFEHYHKILNQQRKDSNKIYSVHEPAVYCMSKGKAHQPYEYGCKVSVAMTSKTGIIVGITSIEKNTSDVHTLSQTIEQVKRITGKLPKEAICDRGYRGRKQVEETDIITPYTKVKEDTRYAKEKTRIKFRRRAAIEPVIGHLKSDHRMGRNFLKGVYGDFVNCVLAAAGFNLKKMLRKIASSWDSIESVVYTMFYCLLGSKKSNLFCVGF